MGKIGLNEIARTYLQLPLRQWDAGNVYLFIVVQLKGKDCRKPHCRNGVVDTFGLGHNAIKCGVFSFSVDHKDHQKKV